MADHPLIRSHRFDPTKHAVDDFECGVDPLDSWLRNHAGVAARMKTAGTYVWVVDGRVVGYYAIAPHAVVRDELPSKVGRNAPDPVAAYIIGKLALSIELHGKGLGSVLLLDAFARLAAAADIAPGRVVVVDATNDTARNFYLSRGFSDVANSPMTLFVTMNDVLASVAGALNELVDADCPEAGCSG